jgi:signal transduction histidine kinase
MYAVLKSNIGRRMLLLAAAAMLPVLTALVISGWMAVQQSQQRLAEDSRRLAGVIGSHVDYILRQNQERLNNVQFAPGVDIQDADPEPEKRALHSTYLGSIFDSVFITDMNGIVLWAEPAVPGQVGTDVSAYPAVTQALEARKPIISDAFAVSDNGPQVILMVSPLRSREGQVAGLVVGEIEPARGGLQALTLPTGLGQTGDIDIIDSHGIILASSDPGRLLLVPPGADSDEVATELAALSSAPWSVAVSQSRAEALAPVRLLESRFVIAGLLAVVVVFFLSWGLARSLVKPIGQLKTAAQNISQGDLEQPVPPIGSDEIGELGRSFDTMRLALKKSLEDIQEWNRQLEQKIEERTRQLQESYREIEQKEGVRRQLLQKVLMVQEEERKRVARELHDETTQSILALVMRLEAAAALPDAEVGKIRQMLNDIRKLAVGTLDSVHGMIFDLRPSVLDDLGLLSAIRWYAQNRLNQNGVKARVEVTGEEKDLPPQVEIALFRVAQEAITNIAKHAGAHHTLVNVEFKDSSITIEVEDDGRGFDMTQLNPRTGDSQGVGLMGMRERVELLGGRFQIESRPGSGTHIIVEVPLGDGVNK